MGRTLTAARATVLPEAESAYIATLAERRDAATAAGRRFWVFRSRQLAGTFLEFAESSGIEEQLSEAEMVIERRLRALAQYGPDVHERWDELALG